MGHETLLFEHLWIYDAYLVEITMSSNKHKMVDINIIDVVRCINLGIEFSR